MTTGLYISSQAGMDSLFVEFCYFGEMLGKAVRRCVRNHKNLEFLKF